MTDRIRRAALGAVLLALSACAPADPRRGDVLLVLLDTVRADHLSSYGYARETTPHLDRLAQEGERFENAWAQAPWTLPAIATLLTGQPPHVHGAGRGERGVFGLRDEVPTLAEQLAAAGYQTGAVFSVIWCGPRLSSLDRGFSHYDFERTDESNTGQRSADEATDAALTWLRSIDERPFFLAVHYFDPHLTYDPPQPWDAKFEPDDEGPRVERGFGSAQQVFEVRNGTLEVGGRLRQSLIARYDGELRFTDEQFGRLRSELERMGRWDDTLVIVVADHGEEFWDHGSFEHGHTHYRELLRVPLIVRRPGGARGVVRGERVRQLDVAPTVLEFAGAESPELPGRVLGGDGARFSVAEGSLWSGDLVSIRSDRGTLIVNRDTGETRFFAFDDTQEQNPEPLTEDAIRLGRMLDALPGPRSRDDSPRPLTEEQLEQLRSLGYIE